MNTRSILSVGIEREADLVVVRQRARRLAELCGFESHDQTRIATAVSEVARDATRNGEQATVNFAVTIGVVPQRLRVRFGGAGVAAMAEDADAGAPPEGDGDGAWRARRLMDHFLRTHDEHGDAVILEKRLPRNKPPVDDTTLEAAVRVLANEAVGDPLSEVRAQNQELLRGLDQVREKQEELTRLNEELENTNRGVVALYGELDRKSTELQNLNRTLEERIMQAVAERERTHEALRQSQKMEAVGQLTGGIAHDFNNLLQTIMGSLEIIGRHLPDDRPRLNRAVAQAMRGAKSAADLTQRLLAFSRQQSLAPKPIDVNQWVGNMVDLLRRTLGETIVVRTQLTGRPLMIEADPNELENAVLNLAVNARDAMPDGGTLTIATRYDGPAPSGAPPNADKAADDFVVIEVCDDGVGMSNAVMSRVFEPFFTTKEVGKGTGLGLAMVYGFAKQSGGDVSAASTEGEGTCIALSFPRWSGAPAPIDAAGGEPVHGAQCDETILVVEDDPAVREYSVEVLRELGYAVLESHDAPSALAVLQSGVPIDLLFTDVVLPGGMTGRQLSQAATSVRPGLKVLFTSGYARNALEHNGRLDADVAMIGKPFTFDHLAGRVREVLGSPRR